jgi:hypothetical protein
VSRIADASFFERLWAPAITSTSSVLFTEAPFTFSGMYESSPIRTEAEIRLKEHEKYATRSKKIAKSLEKSRNFAILEFL